MHHTIEANTDKCFILKSLITVDEIIYLRATSLDSFEYLIQEALVADFMRLNSLPDSERPRWLPKTEIKLDDVNVETYDRAEFIQTHAPIGMGWRFEWWRE
jgi:hypothetical protein